MPESIEQDGRGRDEARQGRARWLRPVVLALVLSALALVGLALEDFAPYDSWWYWVVVLPLFGLICMRLHWARKEDEKRAWPAIRQEVLHWLGFLLALKLMFLLIHSGTLSKNASGLVSLLLLAVCSYYAGIHLTPVFLVVSLLIAVVIGVTAYAEEYLWLVFVVLGLAAALLFLTRKWAPGLRRRLHHGQDPNR